MDRWHRLGVAVAALAVAAGCAGDRRSFGSGKPLAANVSATTAASGLRQRAALTKGRLTYAVAVADRDRVVVSVELELAFALAVHDLSAAKPRLRFRRRLGVATYDIYDLAVDPAGREAWVASADGSVRGFELAKGKQLASLHLGAAATAVALTNDRSLLATGSASGVLCLRRRADLALLQCTVAHEKRISSLSFSADGKALVSASWDGTVTTWRAPSLEVTGRKKLGVSANAVAYSPSGDRVAIAVSGAPPKRSPEIASRETRAGVAYDDKSAVVLWNPGRRTARTCSGHRAPVTSVSFGPRGRRLLSSSWDRTVKLWDTASCRVVASVIGFRQLVRDVAMGSSGRRAAVGAWPSDLSSNSTVAFDLLYP